MTGPRRWCVVGGGVLGLTLALRLSQRGHQVSLLEAGDRLGGLAAAWSIGDVVWDRHYHVTLTSDRHTRGMLDELGLGDELVWQDVAAACWADGRMHPMSSALDFLRFPPLRPIDKARLAATILHAATIRDGRRLESVSVERWLRRWSGDVATERLWLPLLRAKLGEQYQYTSAAFIWATVQRLYRARRAGLGKDQFGYLPGGYGRVFQRYGERLATAGVDVRLGVPVEAVRPDPAGGVMVAPRDGPPTTYDDVVVTAAAPVAARLMHGLREPELRRLADMRYQGVVCASLLLRRPLTGNYLTYITDADVPFTAVIDMTALVDPAQLRGHGLVYLPRYVEPADPWLERSDDQLRGAFLPQLARLYPGFCADRDLLAFRVSRVRAVMPVPTLGYSDRLPPMRTSVPGLHLVSSAHLVNATLNVDETVALAERAVGVIDDGGS